MSTEFKLYNVDEKDLFKNKSNEEKEALLLEMVQYGIEYGFKPAARKYKTYPATIRRWVKIYQEQGEEGLKYKKRASKED